MSTSLTADRPRIRVPAGSTALSNSAFAHLIGLNAQQPAPAVQQQPVAEQDRHDNGQFKPAPKGDDDDDDEMKKAKKDDESDDDDSEDGDDENEDDDDTTDDEESSGKRGKRAATARKNERARCAAIFASEHAAGNIALAAHFAFETNMTRSQAIKALAVAPSGGSQLSKAMAGVPNARVGPGASSEPATPQRVDASWDRAFRAVGSSQAGNRRG